MRFPNLPRLALLLALLLAATLARAGNDYPLVLVHGFMGWGRDEVLGFKYWGGFGDLQETLDRAGYRTYTGVVGPFASSWDRACELSPISMAGRWITARPTPSPTATPATVGPFPACIRSGERWMTTGAFARFT